MINLYLKRFFGFIIDFLIIYLLIAVTSVFIPVVFCIPFFCFLYSFSAAMGLKTAGMKITMLQFENDDQKHLKIKIFIREFIFRWGLFFILPILTYPFFHWYKYVSTYFMLLALSAAFLIVNTVWLLIFKKTLVDVLSKIRMNKIEAKKTELSPKIENENSFLAFLIDFAVIFAITILLFRILINWIYVETILLLFIVTLLYNVVFYLVKKQTFGKIFVGVSVVPKNAVNLSFSAILLREFVCKFLLRYVAILTNAFLCCTFAA